MKKTIFILSVLVFLGSCKDSNSPSYSNDDNKIAENPEYTVIDLGHDFGPYIEISDLSEINQKLKGTWFGTVETPWIDPYHIVFKYYEGNIYSCYNITNNGIPGFYYGTDQDSSIKQIRMKNMLTDGSCEGEITILFGPCSSNIDQIKDLKFYNDYRNLTFSIWHHNVYGPLRVFLYKIAEE
jgi:hypothetical protein